MPGPNGYWDYDTDGNPVWVDLPAESDTQPTGSEPTGGTVTTSSGESWDTILPQGGWGTAPTKAQQQRGKANAAETDYQNKKRAYDAAVAQSASPAGFDGDLNALKASMDVARRDWVTEDSKATALEKAEAATTAKKSASKATGLPNAQFLQKPDGTIIPNPYYVPPKPAASTLRPSAVSPNTSAPFITLMMPDGTIKTVANPNFMAESQKQVPWGTSSAASRYLIRQGPNGDLEQIENPNYEQPEDPMIAWRRAQQQQQAKAGLDLYSRLAEQMPQMLPMAARPGQQYYTGGEPGGFFEQYLKGTGVPYTAENYKAPIIQWNPAQMWEQAMNWYTQQMAQQGGQS